MKLSKRRGALVAAGVAAAMVLSACGGEEGSGTEGGGGGDATGGTFSMYIGEPQNPLVPGNTTESEGDQVVNSLWTGLVGFSAEGELEYSGVAESIESDDNTTWTVTLKDGWTFHDGTPVDAALLRQRVELHRLQPERPGRIGLPRPHRRLRGPAGPRGRPPASPRVTRPPRR